jgi:D-psicose/D-tagatose/L-ribulose 3-epimerase
LKLAISNIAWDPAHDDAVARVMQRLAVSGLEVAPTRIWERPTEASRAEVLEYRERWAARGVEIVAMQALLYGRPDLVVFGSAAERRQTLDYLAAISQLGSWLGAATLVFGSPKNRRVDGVPVDEIRDSAVSFFREAGREAAAVGVRLCIEPNPSQYECNFVTCAADAVALVREVGSEGFGLHLDSGAMTLSGDDPSRTFEECAGSMSHFHVSEPFLAPVGEGPVDHQAFAAALRRADYDGWCSIEMRPASDRGADEQARRALRFATNVYRGSREDRGR